MASGLYASIVGKAVRAAKGRPSQRGIIEAAAEMKKLDLTGTLELRAEQELSDDTIADFFAAADRYVEELVNGVFDGDLNDLIEGAPARYREQDYLDIEAVSGIRDKQGRLMSSLTLATLLNLTLYEYVRPLMESPRLNWQTGRLAHSGRVTSVLAQGANVGSIYFTYMLYPYAVFEPGSGSPLASEERSPTELFTDAINIALQDILSPKSTKFIVRSQ